MGEHTTSDETRTDLEHDQAVSLTRRRARERLTALAAQYPGHQITVETYPGRQDRYVARAVTAGIRPYLLITTDLDELSAELGGLARHRQSAPLRRRGPAPPGHHRRAPSAPGAAHPFLNEPA